MNISIVIPTRLSSTRMPGKAMKALAGKPILWHIIERCKKSKLSQKVILATSTNKEDDAIERLGRETGCQVFRGDLNDVLSRYYGCAKHFKLDAIVRITHDCPLVDPLIIDGVIKTFTDNLPEVDYASNCLNRIFPRGLDCEIMSIDALQWAYENAKDEEREHITLSIFRNPDMRKIPYTVPREYRGNFRLTNDQEEDYKLLNIIYNRFYKTGEIVSMPEVIKYLKNNPDIANINAGVQQKVSIN